MRAAIDNSIVYLSALAAAEELAENSNDTATAATAKTAQTRGVEALMKLLTRTDGSTGRSRPGDAGDAAADTYFASFWCKDSETLGSHALQSSVLYGYNWAMVTGLGAKFQLSNTSIASHLRAELAHNFIAATLCVDNICPAGVSPDSATLMGGVVFATNRTVNYGCTPDYKPARAFSDFTDQDYWEMANADHSSAALWSKAYPTVAEAM